MEHVVPRTDTFVLPEGTVETVVAANQTKDYDPLLALVTPQGHVVTQWLPSPEELQRLRDGEPITLVTWTFGHPFQPIFLAVGPLDLRPQPVTSDTEGGK